MLRIILVAMTTIGIAAPALADSGSGIGAGLSVSNYTLELPNGKILYRSNDKAHLMSEDTPLNNVAQDCSVAYVMEPDFSAGSGHGTCSGIDTDGDVYFFFFSGDLTGGEWEIAGGTGKFADLGGGGTYTVNAPLPDFDRFSFTWTWDSAWPGS